MTKVYFSLPVKLHPKTKNILYLHAQFSSFMLNTNSMYFVFVWIYSLKNSLAHKYSNKTKNTNKINDMHEKNCIFSAKTPVVNNTRLSVWICRHLFQLLN